MWVCQTPEAAETVTAYYPNLSFISKASHFDLSK